MTNEETIKDDWLSHFPCSCGHSPERHVLAPIDGICRACLDCHGVFGAIANWGLALVKADMENPQILRELEE